MWFCRVSRISMVWVRASVRVSLDPLRGNFFNLYMLLRMSQIKH